jgi:hypothetical protein
MPFLRTIEITKVSNSTSSFDRTTRPQLGKRKPPPNPTTRIKTGITGTRTKITTAATRDILSTRSIVRRDPLSPTTRTPTITTTIITDNPVVTAISEYPKDEKRRPRPNTGNGEEEEGG